VHPASGADLDSRFVSREAAKNAKEKAVYGFFAPSPKENSSATLFRPLQILCGVAREIHSPQTPDIPVRRGDSQLGTDFDGRFSSREAAKNAKRKMCCPDAQHIFQQQL
jgi:hypothetical protein